MNNKTNTITVGTVLISMQSTIPKILVCICSISLKLCYPMIFFNVRELYKEQSLK